MTEYIFSNNASGTLLSAMGGSDTTLTLNSGEGVNFPDPGADEQFEIYVKNGNTGSWMICTGRSSDTLTVSRTDSNSFPKGSTVIHAISATVLNLLLQKGVYREVDGSPDGTLAAEYTGEEVLDTTNSLWYKHITGTSWKLMSS